MAYADDLILHVSRLLWWLRQVGLLEKILENEEAKAQYVAVISNPLYVERTRPPQS